MNLLIVSENFIKGGLETHINTYYNLMNKKEHNVIFAFSKYEENGYLKNATIYNDFNFDFNSSIRDFISDVDKLVSIIKKHDIDVVQVHPFYSLFPALFAAKITNIKLIYTYHGYGSINFVHAMTDSLLFSFGIEYGIDKIFCVTENAIENFREFHNNNVVFMPNIIDESMYIEHEVSLKKRWALISRLDYDKYSSIIKFLTLLPELDIDFVDIYGSGTMLDECKIFVKKNKLDEKVKFMGFKSDISKELYDYTGTIGIGRVTLESLCMNYPSILIGFDKVVGVIDADIYNGIKRFNFVPFTLKDIDINDFNKSLKEINGGKVSRYQLRDNVIKDFGTGNIKYYLDEFNNASSISLSIFNDVYNKFKNIDNKNQFFYTSYDVFSVVFNNISSFSRNLYFREISNSYSYIYGILSKQEKLENDLLRLKDNIASQNAQIVSLKKQISDYKKGKIFVLCKKVYSKILKKR